MTADRSKRPITITVFSATLWLGACASEPPRQEALVRETVPAVVPAPVPVARPWTAEAKPQPASLAVPSTPGAVEAGLASYYWQDQMTASGERFDKRAMTAAHKTLPLGARVRVTHMTTGKTVDVRINDRGPFKAGRIIDLSEAAAEQIEMIKAGLAPVKIERLP